MESRHLLAGFSFFDSAFVLSDSRLGFGGAESARRKASSLIRLASFSGLFSLGSFRMRNVSPYPKIGRCIYCDYAGPKADLTTEHIIPKALNGKRQLREASCRECAKETGRLESFVTGNMFATVRTARGDYSRNAKKRKTETPLLVKGTDGAFEELPLLIKGEHPAPLFMPHLPTPGVLDGRDPNAKWGEIRTGCWLQPVRTNKLPEGPVT